MSTVQTSLPSKSKQASSPLPEKAKTCLPSVLGDAPEMVLPSSRICLYPPVVPTFFLHSSLPVVLTHSSASAPRSSLVRKMRSPQTTCVAPHSPGSGSFHRTLSSASHAVGRFFSLLMPSPVGPRHCGQLSAKAADSANSDSPTARVWAATVR